MHHIHARRLSDDGKPRRPDDLARFLDDAHQLLHCGEEERVLQALADRGTDSTSWGKKGLLLLIAVARSTAAGADCKLQALAGSMQQVS